MSLLNPALLSGLAFLSVPIIIHLLNKRRYRVVSWGAMRFLKAAISAQARRLRLEDILLLLVRMALLAFFVAALARPYLKSRTGGVSGEGAAVDVAILLDASFSMGYEENKVTRFDRAREVARRVLKELKKGDTCSVLLFSDRALPLLPGVRHDHEATLRALDAARPSAGATDLPRALEAGLRVLQELKNPSQELVVLSDFQKTSLPADGGASLAGIEELLAKFRGRRPSLYACDVGRTAGANAAVSAIETSPAIVGVRRTTRLTVRVRNLGPAEMKGLRLKLAVDGEPKGLRDLEAAPPGGEVSAAFFHDFGAGGFHEVAAELLEDPLAADNTRWASIRAIERFPVLLLDGRPSPEPFKSGSDLLRRALDPRDADRPDLRNVIAAETTPLADASAELLEGARAVFLLDPPSVPEPLAAALEAFVRKGGGLLVAPGPRANAAALNERLYKNGDGLLPARLLELKGGDAPEAFARVRNRGNEHPAASRFNDPAQGDLGTARIRRWYGLGPSPKGEARTVLALENGDPLLVEGTLGRGRVMLLSTSGDGSWHDLFKHPFCIPLFNDVAFHLGQAVSAPRNVAVGQPIQAEAEPEEGMRLLVRHVHRGETPVEPRPGEDGVSRIVFERTEAPGSYALLRTGPPGREAETLDLFAVNVAARESDLSPLSSAERAEAGRRIGMAFHDDASSLAAALEVGRKGREYGELLLFLALACLVVEPCLTRRFSARRLAEGAMGTPG